MDESKKDIKSKTKSKKEKKPKKRVTKKRKTTKKPIKTIQETQSSKFVSNLPFGKPPISALSAFGGGGQLGGSALTQPFGAIFSREISPNKGTPQNPVNIFQNPTPSAINGKVISKEFSPEEDIKTQKEIQSKLTKLFKNVNVKELKEYLDMMYKDDDLGKYYLDVITEPQTKIGVIKKLVRYTVDYPQTFMISELEDYFKTWYQLNQELNLETQSNNQTFLNLTSPSFLSSTNISENPNDLNSVGFSNLSSSSSDSDVSLQYEDEDEE